MATDPKTVVTEIISGLSGTGEVDRATAEDLFPVVYDELRRLAKGYMSRETPGHTLQPTALVHEAYLKLVDADRLEARDRSHFLALAARAMRQILVDAFRRRSAAKRGSAQTPLQIEDGLLAAPERGGQILELDAALRRLAEVDSRLARVVELKFFGGLQHDEIATVLGVSTRTARRDWMKAKAWLAVEIAPSAHEAD